MRHLDLLQAYKRVAHAIHPVDEENNRDNLVSVLFELVDVDEGLSTEGLEDGYKLVSLVSTDGHRLCRVVAADPDPPIGAWSLLRKQGGVFKPRSVEDVRGFNKFNGVEFPKWREVLGKQTLRFMTDLVEFREAVDVVRERAEFYARRAADGEDLLIAKAELRAVDAAIFYAEAAKEAPPGWEESKEGKRLAEERKKAREAFKAAREKKDRDEPALFLRHDPEQHEVVLTAAKCPREEWALSAPPIATRPLRGASASGAGQAGALEMAFNARYLSQALAGIKARTVRLGIEDKYSPMRLDFEPGCFVVVMPMRF